MNAAAFLAIFSTMKLTRTSAQFIIYSNVRHVFVEIVSRFATIVPSDEKPSTTY